MSDIKKSILIVGSGSAGIAAAVAAQNSDTNVCLIERNDFPGGKATAAEVGTICGLYLRSKSGNPKYSNFGYPVDFSKKLAEASQTQVEQMENGLLYLPYKIEAFKTIALSEIKNNNIDFRPNTKITAIHIEHNKINEVVLDSIEGGNSIKVDAVIDCSGAAIVSTLAKISVLKSDEYQSMAQIFEVSGIDADEAFNVDISIKRAGLAANNERLKNYILGTSLVPGSLIQGSAKLKMGLPKKVTDDENQMNLVSKQAIEILSEVFEFLQINVAAFKNSKLISVAPEIGLRVEKRALGKYVLTRNDVLNCIKRKDAVCAGSWPIESWREGYKLKMDFFPENDFYHIPASCLESKFIENLFMSGRNISADDDAIASARVIGTCLATGYASGKLAAGYCNNEPKEKAIQNLQKTLLNNIRIPR